MSLVVYENEEWGEKKMKHAGRLDTMARDVKYFFSAGTKGAYVV